MLQSLTYFCEKLFIWKPESEEILIKEFLREEHESCEDETIVIPITEKSYIRCGMQVIENCLKKNLYIITENCTKSFVINIYKANLINGKWCIKDIGTFQADNSVFESIRLSNGPLLFWIENDELKGFSCKPNNKIATNFHHKQTIFSQQKVEKILQLVDFNTATEIINSSETDLLLLCFKSKDEIFIGIILNLIDGYKPIHLLPINYFFPEIYKPIISAIKITVILKNQTNICLQDIDILNLNWFSNHTIICTKKKQFIVFINGYIKYNCNIPFPDVYDILNFNVCSLNFFQTFYILQSSKGACAIKKCDNSELLKVHCSWDDSLIVCLGNFCHIGNVQLVFFASFEPELIMETCIVTDIYNTYYPRHIKSLQILQESECSYALEGMKKRLNAGKIALSEINDKNIDTQKTMERIFNSLEKKNSVCFKQKITDIDLLDITSFQTEDHIIFPNELNLDKITIIEKWNVVLKDHWILGWTLLNHNDILISDVNVNLHNEKEIIEYDCKWYVHSSNNEDRFDLPYSKTDDVKLKQGEVFSIVCSIPLSVFINSVIYVISYIKWKNISPDDQTIITKHTPLQWNILNIKKVFDDNNFRGLKDDQKLMSLRILQEKQIIALTSLYTDLSQIEKILSEFLSLEQNYIIENFPSKIYIFINQVNPIFGGNFSVKLFSSNKAEIKFYYRETTQLLIFLHWLQEFLPDDINIHPTVNLINTTDGKQNLISLLKEELQLILTFIEENHNKMIEKHQSNEQMYSNDVMLKSEEYSNFRFQLLEKELESDNKVAQLNL